MVLDYKFPLLEGNKPTLYNNPFNKKCVEAIHLHIYGQAHTLNGYMYARIVLKNNNTTAEHEIMSKTFQELVEKSQQFINSLED